MMWGVEKGGEKLRSQWDKNVHDNQGGDGPSSVKLLL